MLDLYKVLGVRKNASKSSIRSAYRRLVKSAHPDAGGSEDQFNMLKLAHDVLMDDVSRAHYNATGEAKTERDDRSPVLQMISQALDMIVMEAVKSGASLRDTPMIKVLEDVLHQQMSKFKSDKAQGAKLQAAYSTIVDRFETGGEENTLTGLVRGRVAMIENALKICDQNIKVAAAAIKLVKTHTFRQEIRQRTLNVWHGAYGATTGTW